MPGNAAVSETKGFSQKNPSELEQTIRVGFGCPWCNFPSVPNVYPFPAATSPKIPFTREYVLVSTNDRHGRVTDALVIPLSKMILVRKNLPTQGIPDFKTFLDENILVGMSELQIFAAVKINCMILVV